MTKEMLEKMIDGLVAQAETFKEIARYLPSTADKEQERLYAAAEANEKQALALRKQMEKTED